jgi:hypothetical protein
MYHNYWRVVVLLLSIHFAMGCAVNSCILVRDDSTIDKKSTEDASGNKQTVSERSEAVESQEIPLVRFCKLTDVMWFDRKEGRFTPPQMSLVPLCNTERELLLLSSRWPDFKEELFVRREIRLFLGLDLPPTPLSGVRVNVVNHRFPHTSRLTDGVGSSLLDRTEDLSGFHRKLIDAGAEIVRRSHRPHYTVTSSVTEVSRPPEESLMIDVNVWVVEVSTDKEIMNLRATGFRNTGDLVTFFDDVVEEISYIHITPHANSAR